MNSNKIALAVIPVWCISVFVFLFGALALIVPSGYTYGPSLLLLFGLGYLVVRPYPALNNADKYLMATLLLYFLVGVVTNGVHHLPVRNYDNFSRVLFAVPVLLLLLRVPVNPIFVWLGIALGALGAGLIALWDFHVNSEVRAAGHNNAIQFGDIAILFSCLLLMSLAWARQTSRILAVFFLLCIVSGVWASLLSGARGGWLALPVALWLFYVANSLQKKNKKAALVIIVTVLAAGLAYQFISPGLLLLRMQDALVDLQQYFQANNANTSLGARITLWRASFPLIAEQPLLGWGSLDNYVALSGDSADIFQRFNHFHNDVLDALVKRGLLGGVALIGVYAVPAVLFYQQLKQCSPQGRPFVYAGLMLVLAAVIFGFTQSFFSHSSGVMVYVFMLVILWAQVRSAAKQLDNK